MIPKVEAKSESAARPDVNAGTNVPRIERVAAPHAGVAARRGTVRPARSGAERCTTPSADNTQRNAARVDDHTELAADARPSTDEHLRPSGCVRGRCGRAEESARRPPVRQQRSQGPAPRSANAAAMTERKRRTEKSEGERSSCWLLVVGCWLGGCWLEVSWLLVGHEEGDEPPPITHQQPTT